MGANVSTRTVELPNHNITSLQLRMGALLDGVVGEPNSDFFFSIFLFGLGSLHRCSGLWWLS